MLFPPPCLSLSLSLSPESDPLPRPPARADPSVPVAWPAGGGASVVVLCVAKLQCGTPAAAVEKKNEQIPLCCGLAALQRGHRHCLHGRYCC